MKKTIILTLLCALVMGARAADYNYIVFTLTDGTTQTVTANDLNIAFADGNLIASSGSTTLATISLASLTKMEFTNDGSTGIQTLKADVTLDEATEIYDLNGRRLPNNAQLSRGIYIIKSNGRTSKVQIK